MGALLTFLLLWLGDGPTEAGHLAINPVYRQMLQQGVAADDPRDLQLPRPTLADGLDAQKQHDLIDALGRPRYSFDGLARPTVVAPHILRTRMHSNQEGGSPMRSVDFWFICRGRLHSTVNQDLLQTLFGDAKADQGRALTEKELAKRGIRVAGVPDQETYVHGAYDLLKKVRISGTGRVFTSRTADSVLVAVKLDQRFAEDPQFANRWYPLAVGQNLPAAEMTGTTYAAAGFYVKVTELRDPADALFVECHLLHSEPESWFQGANLLGSKLPLVVQAKVREARRELMRVSSSGPQ